MYYPKPEYLIIRSLGPLLGSSWLVKTFKPKLYIVVQYPGELKVNLWDKAGIIIPPKRSRSPTLQLSTTAYVPASWVWVWVWEPQIIRHPKKPETPRGVLLCRTTLNLQIGSGRGGLKELQHLVDLLSFRLGHKFFFKGAVGLSLSFGPACFRLARCEN